MDENPPASPNGEPGPAPRGGWGAPVALGLLAATLSFVNPGLLLLVPLALTLLSLPPRRPVWVGIGAFLLVIAIVGQTGDALWWFGRGWALILGAWFILAIVLVPGGGFINRGLAAVFGASFTAALLMLLTRAGWTQIDAAIGARLSESAALAAEQWSRALSGTTMGDEAGKTMAQIAEMQARLHPALLALASLCALAVAWFVWRRLAMRDARPLSRLREFRFRDELIWLLVAAVILLVLPLNDAATRTGTNVALFMAALYALRGLAIVVALFGTPGPVGVVFGFIAFLFLFPMVTAATLVLGLSDTWLDLRTRARLQREGK